MVRARPREPAGAVVAGGDRKGQKPTRRAEEHTAETVARGQEVSRDGML